MSATRLPHFKRHLAGRVGGLVFATAMVLTAYPTIAGAVPPLQKLTLEAVCTIVSGEHAGQAVMVVGNKNDNPVVYDWTIASASGTRNAPFGDNYELFPAAAGKLTLKVGNTQQDSIEEDPSACVAHVLPTKVWLDAEGDAIESPLVPEGWNLTLQSDIETLTCTWNSGLDELKCHSVDDPEDKLDFDDLDKSLEVPVGGEFTIAETPTPGFLRTGLGNFGPINLPANRAAFFAGGNNVPVLVTNAAQATGQTTTTVAETTTTVAETTTTTASPPTTLAPVEETTTTTASPPTTLAPVEETTTTAEETTTTAEETTTTTSSPPTTLAPVEETTTTASPPTTLAPVEETTTSSVEQSTSTTLAELKTAEDTTTTAAPTTTAASSTTTAQTTTTFAPTDTASPTTTPEPTRSGPPWTTPAPVDPFRAPEPLSEGPAQSDSSGALPNSDELDTLPTTGSTPIPAVAVGFGLVVIGTWFTLAARRRRYV